MTLSVQNQRLRDEAIAIAARFARVESKSVPAGGTIGQVLTKAGSADYSMAWADASGGGSWGSVTGTLSAQTDLQAALDAKQAAGSYLTANQSITLSGDISGSGATAITVAIGANKVTRAMLAATGGATILGATGAGNVTDLTAAQAKTFLAVTASDVSGLATVATSASAADLSAGTLLAARMPALTGDITTSAGAVATAIGANKVLDTMLRQSAGLSIVGRSANTTGNVADITAASDGQVLRRSGTAIGFGSLDLSVSGTVGTSRLAYVNITASTAASKILGRTSASAGDWQEITLGTNLSMSGTTLNAASGGLSDGDKGDITVSASGATWTVDNSVISYAKIQNVSATDKLLGRSTAGAGVVEEITCTSAGRALIDDADAAAQRATLGFLTSSTQTTSYTTVLADSFTLIKMNSASGLNLTVPPNSSVAYPVDSEITIAQVGAGQVTIVAGAGVTINSPGGVLTLSGQYAVVMLKKTATDTWLLTGDLSGSGGGTTTNALTMNNGGSGAASGTTFDGSVARTISYNTLGAAPQGAATASGLTMATARLLGRTTASTGAIEEISAGATLSLSAGALGVASVPNAVTFDITGGAAAASTFNGSAARTVDYSTVGAKPDAPRIQAVTSSATVTPTFSNDMVKITAQAAGLTLANPTGTAVAGRKLIIRIKDNGTARGITFDTQFRAIGVTLPTTTVISKTLYLGFVYNSDDTKWDVVAVSQEA